MNQRGCFSRQNLFRFVDLGAPERGEPVDLVERQHREQFQEPRDVAVFGVAPILPIFVRTDLIGIEPDRAGSGLAHLGARRGGDERRGQREELRVVQAAAKIDAADDIAPLIRSAHLQHAAVTPIKFDEVIGLQDHVVEFEER